MGNSLEAGVSGLRAHQDMLDVVGNNLANINTPGFKSSRVTFADLISETVRSGTAPTDTQGGINPSQIGQGVRLGAIEQDMRQGGLQTTGRTLDLALEGEGYFVLSDGTNDMYSRVGTFGIDSNNNLVSTTSGLRVQSATGEDIVIDVNSTLPAAETQTVDFTGNLDALASPPVAAQLTTPPLSEGSPAQITGSNGQPFALADGQQFTLRANGQAAQTVTFRTADFAAIGAATAAEVAAAINAQLTGVVATNVGGSVQLASTQTGNGSSLDVDDALGSPAFTLGLSTTLTFGTEVPASATTNLNDIPQNTSDYVAGDIIDVAGLDADGTPISATFVFGTGPGQNGTTLGDLQSFLQGLYTNANVSINTDGSVQIDANAVGESPLQLVLTDGPVNAGFTSFSSIPYNTTVEGDDGATLQTSIEVIDAQGSPHAVLFTLHKTGANEWEVTATLPDGDGTVLDGDVQGVRFNDDGSFDFVSGIGIGDPNIEIVWAGTTTTQSIALDFGANGEFSGLTQFGGATTAGATEQDGYTFGTLSSLNVNSEGQIQGIYTNGQIQVLDQLGITTFANPAGLQKLGDSLLAASPASGAPTPTTALSGRAGKVVSGSLEGSNVDIALEFTRLITAQRGFQVNSRTITTTDQMLQELANLIR
ncbi:MAG: flagellar hook-basal body complex protein [Planctomycetota bacterium]